MVLSCKRAGTEERFRWGIKMTDFIGTANYDDIPLVKNKEKKWKRGGRNEIKQDKTR